jgi:hypothetical protein
MKEEPRGAAPGHGTGAPETGWSSPTSAAAEYFHRWRSSRSPGRSERQSVVVVWGVRRREHHRCSGGSTADTTAGARGGWPQEHQRAAPRASAGARAIWPRATAAGLCSGRGSDARIGPFFPGAYLVPTGNYHFRMCDGGCNLSQLRCLDVSIFLCTDWQQFFQIQMWLG